MIATDDILDDVEPRGHLVQFYDADEDALATNVGRFIADALKRDGCAIMIASEDHRASIVREVERRHTDPESALRDGRLVALDAHETLARFIVGGHPDKQRFETIVASLVRNASARAAGRGLRVYGEMVGLLWKAGQFAAAIRLEQLWNSLLKSVDFDLFCAYPIDVFGKDFEYGILDALLCAHTHLLPSLPGSSIDVALQRAMREVLGDGDGWKQAGGQTHRDACALLPQAEATILWLRSNVPARADEILSLARQYCQATA